MKDKNTFKTGLLISSAFFFIVFFTMQVVLKYFNLSTLSIWPEIVIESVISAVIWFFLMSYWMKRKLKKRMGEQEN